MTNLDSRPPDPPSPGLHEIHEFLRVLANETRGRILFDIFKDASERTVGEVAASAGIGLSTASEYLADMRRAGILKSRRAHKEVLYQPDQTRLLSHLERLIAAISQCCCTDCAPFTSAKNGNA